jgi:diguanylate cyclase (GGDEF)-like protein
MDEMAHIDWMSITHPDDLQKDLDTMALMNAGKIPGFQMEKRYLHKDGTAVWISMTIAPVHLENKTLPLHLCMIEDISERKKTEQTVYQLAYYDLLTQLPNRMLLQDRLTQAMLAGKRNERYGALIFLDLDNFKSLNDTMGHSTGDLLLIEVAKRLKTCVREIDTVSRFGGDEFVVLLQEMSRDMTEARSQAYQLSEKICNALAAPYELALTADNTRPAQRMIHRCSASVGVALFLGMEMSEEEVIKRADIAMYQSKAEGRNRVQFYEVSRRLTASL